MTPRRTCSRESARSKSRGAASSCTSGQYGGLCKRRSSRPRVLVRTSSGSSGFRIGRPSAARTRGFAHEGHSRGERQCRGRSRMGFPARRLPASASTDAGHASAPTRSNGSSSARASSDSNPTRVAVRHARGCDFRAGTTSRASATPAIRRGFPTSGRVRGNRSDRVRRSRPRGSEELARRPTPQAQARREDRIDQEVRCRSRRRAACRDARRHDQRPWGQAVQALRHSLLRADLRNYIRPEFGHRKLSDVEHLDIQDFIDALHGQGLSARRSTTPSTR